MNVPVTDALNHNLSLRGPRSVDGISDDWLKKLQEKYSGDDKVLAERVRQRAERIGSEVHGWHALFFDYDGFKPDKKQSFLADVKDKSSGLFNLSFNPFGETDVERFYEKVKAKVDVYASSLSGVKGVSPFGKEFSQRQALELGYKASYHLEQIESELKQTGQSVPEKPAAPEMSSGWSMWYSLLAGIQSWFSDKSWDELYKFYETAYLKSKGVEIETANWDSQVEHTREVMTELRKRLEKDGVEPAIARQMAGVDIQEGDKKAKFIDDKPWALQLDMANANDKLLAEKLHERVQIESPRLAKQLLAESGPMDLAAVGGVTVAALYGAKKLAQVGGWTAKTGTQIATLGLVNFGKSPVALIEGKVAQKGAGKLLGGASKLLKIGGIPAYAASVAYNFYGNLKPELEKARDANVISDEDYNFLIGAARVVSFEPTGFLDKGALELAGFDVEDPRIKTHILGQSGIIKQAMDQFSDTPQGRIDKVLKGINADQEYQVALAYGRILAKNPGKQLDASLVNGSLEMEAYRERFSESGFLGVAIDRNDPVYQAFIKRSAQRNNITYSYEGVNQAITNYVKQVPDHGAVENMAITGLKASYDKKELLDFAKFLKLKLNNKDDNSIPANQRNALRIYMESNGMITTVDYHDAKVAGVKQSNNFGQFPLIQSLYAEFQGDYQASNKLTFQDYLKEQQTHIESGNKIWLEISQNERDKAAVSSSSAIDKYKTINGLDAKIAQLKEQKSALEANIDVKPENFEFRYMTASHLMADISNSGHAYEKLMELSLQNGQTFQQFTSDLQELLRAQAVVIGSNNENKFSTALIPVGLFGANMKQNPGAKQLAGFPYMEYPTDASIEKRKQGAECVLRQFDIFEQEIASRFQSAHFEVPMMREQLEPNTTAPGVIDNALEKMSLIQVHWSLQELSNGKMRNPQFGQWLADNNYDLQTIKDRIDKQARYILKDYPQDKPVDYEDPKIIEKLSVAGTLKDAGNLENNVRDYLTHYVEGVNAETAAKAFRTYYEAKVEDYKKTQVVLQPFAKDDETRMDTTLAVKHMFIIANLDADKVDPGLKELVTAAKAAKEKFESAYAAQISQSDPDKIRLNPTLDESQMALFASEFKVFFDKFRTTYANRQVVAQVKADKHASLTQEEMQAMQDYVKPVSFTTAPPKVGVVHRSDMAALVENLSTPVNQAGIIYTSLPEPTIQKSPKGAAMFGQVNQVLANVAVSGGEVPGEIKPSDKLPLAKSASQVFTQAVSELRA